MDELIMALMGLATLAAIAKVCKIIREVILTIVYALGLLVAIKFAVKWILIPMFRYIGIGLKKLWIGFRYLCTLIDKHYSYRDRIPSFDPTKISMANSSENI